MDIKKTVIDGQKKGWKPKGYLEAMYDREREEGKGKNHGRVEEVGENWMKTQRVRGK